MILTEKEKAWTKLCRNETNPFGLTKKLAFQQFQDSQISYLPDSSSLSSRSEVLWGLTEDIFGKSAVPSQNYNVKTSHDQQPFTEREIKNAIYSFNINKAPGYDQIDHRLIRNIYQRFPEKIHNMYNTLLDLNYFPSDWKLGELVYFRKEGKPNNLSSSYRPITLLPIFGKILEKLILRRINHKLANENILTGKQHGYTQNKSTETALEQVLSLIELYKSEKKYTSLVSLDFRGAFDNLLWDLVIQALRRLKISEQLIKGFVSGSLPLVGSAGDAVGTLRCL